MAAKAKKPIAKKAVAKKAVAKKPAATSKSSAKAALKKTKPVAATSAKKAASKTTRIKPTVNKIAKKKVATKVLAEESWQASAEAASTDTEQRHGAGAGGVEGWRIVQFLVDNMTVFGLANDQRIYRWNTRNALWHLHKEGV